MSDPASMEDVFRELINGLMARQALTEHMVFELYINHAKARPDPNEVMERLYGRLRDVRDVNFSGENLSSLRDTCDWYIENLKSGYETSGRANGMPW